MINEKLVHQVREGKASIEHTRKPEDLIKLRSVLHECWPKDKTESVGSSIFYYKWPDKDLWIDHVENPTSLTPIPLDYFFKGEEEDIKHPQHPVKPVGKLWRFLPTDTPPQQSSLPSGVQTMDEKSAMKEMIDWLESQREVCLKNGNTRDADFLNGHIRTALAIIERTHATPSLPTGVQTAEAILKKHLPLALHPYMDNALAAMEEYRTLANPNPSPKGVEEKLFTVEEVQSMIRSAVDEAYTAGQNSINY